MSGKKSRVKTFKLDEELEEQIDALAKLSGRTKDGQIRELLRLGIEKAQEQNEPVYRRSDLEKIVGQMVEERMAQYDHNAKDGDPPQGTPHKKHHTA